jgi:hypothetical protein
MSKPDQLGIPIAMPLEPAVLTIEQRYPHLKRVERVYHPAEESLAPPRDLQQETLQRLRPRHRPLQMPLAQPHKPRSRRSTTPRPSLPYGFRSPRLSVW